MRSCFQQDVKDGRRQCLEIVTKHLAVDAKPRPSLLRPAQSDVAQIGAAWSWPGPAAFLPGGNFGFWNRKIVLKCLSWHVLVCEFLGLVVWVWDVWVWEKHGLDVWVCDLWTWARIWDDQVCHVLVADVGGGITGHLGLPRPGFGTHGFGKFGCGISRFGMSPFGICGRGVSGSGMSGLGTSMFGAARFGMSGLGTYWFRKSGLGTSRCWTSGSRTFGSRCQRSGFPGLGYPGWQYPSLSCRIMLAASWGSLGVTWASKRTRALVDSGKM